jgi:hypothetical protein
MGLALLDTIKVSTTAAHGAVECWKGMVENMKSLNIRKTITAGLAGTVLMTIIMVMAPLMGMPKMDIAAMLGSMLTGEPPAPGSFAWIVGLALHLTIGTGVLSAIYALAKHYLPTSSPFAKGLIFGVIGWLVAQVMVMPMMGAGLFSSNMPQGAMMAIGSLMGHLIYGAVLGSVYGLWRSAKSTDGCLTDGV